MMQTTTNPQLGLFDSLLSAPPTNDFLARLAGRWIGNREAIPLDV